MTFAHPACRGALGAVIAAVAVATVLGTTSDGSHREPVPPPGAPASREATPAPVPLRALTLLGLGDSVMAGTNCGCETIPTRLARLLEHRERRPVAATNLGTAGYTTTDVLRQLNADSSARRAVRDADVLVLIVGANDLNDALAAWRESDCDRDCYQPRVDAMRERLASILRLVESLRAGRPGPLLVDTYWNVFTDGDVARSEGGEGQVSWSREVTGAANAAITEATRALGGQVVDLTEPFTRHGGDDPTPLLADDGDHPNSAGVDAIVHANLDAIPEMRGDRPR